MAYGTGSGQHVPDAPCVVMLHGAGFDFSVWVMFARYFARHGFNVIAPDLPAHGRSEGPALTSIEAIADWVAGLLDAHQIDATHLVGHSMGSLAAMEFAQRYASRTRSLALLGTSAPMPVGPPLLNAAADDHPAAFAMANTWSHSYRARVGAGANPGVNQFVSGQRWLQRMPPGVYHADLAACNAYQADPVALSVPGLVVAGSADKMTGPAAGAAVANKLGAKYLVLEGSGHAMLTEQPNQLLDALADHMPAADE